MTTTWQIKVDWDRKGDFSDPADDITAYVSFIDWELGMRRPYGDTARDSVLEMTLDNSDRRFSPENASSPLVGKLGSFRPVQLTSHDGITERIMWTGWIESIQPDVNQYANRQVRIVAAGPMQFFKGTETNVSIIENKCTHEIVETLIQQVKMPGQYGILLDTPGYMEMTNDPATTVTLLSDAEVFPTLTYTLEDGLTMLAYAADNWVQRGGDEEKAFNVYRAIADVAAAERGRFLFDRAGQARFWNRFRLLHSYGITPTVLDNSMNNLRYTFAGPDEFRNHVTIVCNPRTISEDTNVLLWSLEREIRIRANETREFGASYRDESENRIGGKDVTLENVTYKAAVEKNNPTYSADKVAVTIEPYANRAVITVKNDNDEDIILQTCEVRGQKITDFGRMESIQSDEVSILMYGKRSMTMHLPSIDDYDYTEALTRFELDRRRVPTGAVQSVTLISHGTEGGEHHTEQLALSLGDLVEIREAQSDHNAQYFIIGESHRLLDGATHFETTWHLEPLSQTEYIQIDNADGLDDIDSVREILP